MGNHHRVVATDQRDDAVFWQANVADLPSDQCHGRVDRAEASREVARVSEEELFEVGDAPSVPPALHESFVIDDIRNLGE